MNYVGKIYGKIGPNEYFDTEKTSEDWDELEAKNKDLTKTLEAILSLTSDEQSPLMKALHEIAYKTFKQISKKIPINKN